MEIPILNQHLVQFLLKPKFPMRQLTSNHYNCNTFIPAMTLPITFDGNTTKMPQSVYTVHVITPVHWVFLVEGDELSEESHTGAKVSEVLQKVITSHNDAEHFSGVASDNTGNTTLTS
ncbi:hypothetical protein M405DRAFT_889192 [Rhizopogon salebrosus TDB-379]|nr:hypothetical protein M405DRAFT_889192 [Rhizopogon salebrosus TDB-379]